MDDFDGICKHGRYALILIHPWVSFIFTLRILLEEFDLRFYSLVSRNGISLSHSPFSSELFFLLLSFWELEKIYKILKKESEKVGFNSDYGYFAE